MLVKADLSHNKIVTISDDSFSNQGKLRQLNLEGNKVSRMTNRTFYGLSQLQALILRANIIEALPDGAFAPVSSLRELDLSRNRIGEISDTAFTGNKDIYNKYYLRSRFFITGYFTCRFDIASHPKPGRQCALLGAYYGTGGRAATR